MGVESLSRCAAPSHTQYMVSHEKGVERMRLDGSALLLGLGKGVLTPFPIERVLKEVRL